MSTNWKRSKAKFQRRRNLFWQKVAKSYLKAEDALIAEFDRHEEAVRKIIIRLRAERGE